MTHSPSKPFLNHRVAIGLFNLFRGSFGSMENPGLISRFRDPTFLGLAHTIAPLETAIPAEQIAHLRPRITPISVFRAKDAASAFADRAPSCTLDVH
jgi:hypothetical protein